jgi:hypothetical protein
VTLELRPPSFGQPLHRDLAFESLQLSSGDVGVLQGRFVAGCKSLSRRSLSCFARDCILSPSRSQREGGYNASHAIPRSPRGPRKETGPDTTGLLADDIGVHVTQLDPEGKAVVKSLLEGLLLKHTTKRLVTTPQPNDVARGGENHSPRRT